MSGAVSTPPVRFSASNSIFRDARLPYSVGFAGGGGEAPAGVPVLPVFLGGQDCVGEPGGLPSMGSHRVRHD